MSSEEYSDGDTTISSKYNNRLLAPNMLCMLLVILFGIVASTCNVISCCNVSTGESEIGTVGPNRLRSFLEGGKSPWAGGTRSGTASGKCVCAYLMQSHLTSDLYIMLSRHPKG